MMRDRKIKQTRLNRKWKDHNARRKRLLQRLRAKMEKEILSGHVHLPAASVSVTLATAYTHTHTRTPGIAPPQVKIIFHSLVPGLELTPLYQQQAIIIIIVRRQPSWHI